MGIEIEFNPDLALRAYGTNDRAEQECLPEKLEVGMHYEFMKKGQRNYWLKGEIPLVETNGNGVFSRPLASILIINKTHEILGDGEIYTKGDYQVKEVFDESDPMIHFEGFDRVRR